MTALMDSMNCKSRGTDRFVSLRMLLCKYLPTRFAAYPNRIATQCLLTHSHAPLDKYGLVYDLLERQNIEEAMLLQK